MEEKVVQSVDCSNTADAVSHKVDDRKTDGNKVEMTWTPDKDYGEVIFRLVAFFVHRFQCNGIKISIYFIDFCLKLISWFPLHWII